MNYLTEIFNKTEKEITINDIKFLLHMEKACYMEGDDERMKEISNFLSDTCHIGQHIN